MDSWSRTREVEKPKPAKVQAGEQADFLSSLLAMSDPVADLVLLSRKRVDSLVTLLRQLSGAAGSSRG